MRRRRHFFSSLALDVLLVAALVTALQLTPAGIVLIYVGWVVNIGLIVAFLLALVIDSLFGPLPRVAILVPILAIAGFSIWYAWAYQVDRGAISVVEAELQRRNLFAPIPFDSARDSYVSGFRNSDAILNFRIPVIYSRNFVHEGFVSLSIRPASDCDVYHKTDNPSGTDILRRTFQKDLQKWVSYCLTRGEIKIIPGNKFEIAEEVMEETIGGADVMLTVHNLTVNGVQMASYSTGTIQALSPFPLPIVGCHLISQSLKWTCGGQFLRQPHKLDTVPGAGTPDSTAMTGILLDVNRRSVEEIEALTAM